MANNSNNALNRLTQATAAPIALGVSSSLLPCYLTWWLFSGSGCGSSSTRSGSTNGHPRANSSQGDIAALQRALEQARKELQDRSSDSTDWETRYHESQAELQEAQAKCETELDNLQEQLKDQEAALAEAKSQQEVAADQAEKALAGLAAEEVKLEDLENKFQTLEAALADSAQQSADCDEALKTAQADLEQARASNDELRSELESRTATADISMQSMLYHGKHTHNNTTYANNSPLTMMFNLGVLEGKGKKFEGPDAMVCISWDQNAAGVQDVSGYRTAEVSRDGEKMTVTTSYYWFDGVLQGKVYEGQYYNPNNVKTGDFSVETQ